MIKKISLTCFILISFLLQGQIQSGKVIYTLKKNLKNVLSSKELTSASFQNDFLEIGESLHFELQFNGTESEFKLSESMSIDKNEFKTRMAIFILRGNSVFYTNLKNQNLIEYREYIGEKLIITNSLHKYTWELTNDSKKIKGYNCYKAVGIKYGSDKNGNTTEHPIIAWYTPEISFQYGPYESSGLPGLVLEYELGQFKWITDKITLDKKERVIEIDTSGRKITEKEIINELKRKMN